IHLGPDHWLVLWAVGHHPFSHGLSSPFFSVDHSLYFVELGKGYSGRPRPPAAEEGEWISWPRSTPISFTPPWRSSSPARCSSSSAARSTSRGGARRRSPC